MSKSIFAIAAIFVAAFFGSAVQACNPVHTVVRGDSLSKIAFANLGNIFAYQSIYDLNRDVIGNNPDLIYVGIVLKIPCTRTADNPIDWSVMPNLDTLIALQNTPGLQILDIRSAEDVAEGVIPGAISVPFAKWRGPAENPGRPPSAAQLSQVIGDAGLDLEQPIILIHHEPGLMDNGRAAIVYWLLKSSGADTLAILRGGFDSWASAKLPIATRPISLPAKTVEVTFSTEWRATAFDIYGVATGQVPGHLLDARPHEIFQRLDTLGNAVANTIPTARNAPVGPLMTAIAGKFDPEDGVNDVLAYLDRHGADWTEAPVISFCNTGELAALNWFYASELAGLDNMVLYPESVHGWASEGGVLALGDG